MNMNPSNRQCEVARAMTQSDAPNDVIREELKKLTEAEWYEQCAILDKFLEEHNAPFDKAFHIMVGDFINIGAANSVDEATVFVAYMEWKNRDSADKTVNYQMLNFSTDTE